jgi:hypothetical protein
MKSRGLVLEESKDGLKEIAIPIKNANVPSRIRISNPFLSRGDSVSNP